MNTMKRTNEEGQRLDEFLEQWNASNPHYQINTEDLQRPRPMFVIEAIFEVFDAVGLDGDDIINTPIEGIEDETCEAFRVLAPILNLTEAVNRLLSSILVEFLKITPFDLLTPNPLITLQLLKCLLNYMVFTQLREAEAQEQEKEVQGMLEELEQLLDQKDALEDELRHINSETTNRDQRMRQLSEKIELLKIEPIEHEEKIEELEKQLLELETEISKLNLTRDSHHSRQTELQHQLNELQRHVVAEEEREKVLQAREHALQLEREATAMREEATDGLFGREAAINTLRASLQHIQDCKGALDSVMQLTDKINDVERTNDPYCEEEAELEVLKAERLELTQQIDEHKAADAAWKADAEKACLEAEQELEANLIEDKKSEEELERCNGEVEDCNLQVRELQAATLKYNQQRDLIMAKYTQEIPKEFDVLIEMKVQSIKAILENTLRKKCDHK